MSGEVLQDAKARAAIATGTNGISVEGCRCGRLHVALRHGGAPVVECIATVEQIAAAADVLSHVAKHLSPEAPSLYAAPAVAEGCLTLSPGKAAGKVRLAIGSEMVASVSVDLSHEELVGVAISFASAAQCQSEARASRDDIYGHAELDRGVVSACESTPDAIAAAGCSCGHVHVYAVRAGAITLRLDLTPDESRAMSRDLSLAAGAAETLAADAPKPN